MKKGFEQRRFPVWKEGPESEESWPAKIRRQLEVTLLEKREDPWRHKKIPINEAARLVRTSGIPEEAQESLFTKIAKACVISGSTLIPAGTLTYWIGQMRGDWIALGVVGGIVAAAFLTLAHNIRDRTKKE